jgi:DMSO/TMAO reductase YedYZ heme-binding membrane subunit
VSGGGSLLPIPYPILFAMMKAVKTREKTYSLLNNSRFYILVCSLVVSVATFAWLRLTAESNQLLLIRTQQLYGFICLVLWYIALIISPLGYVIGKHRMGHIAFARRAIGVSAFYFALLHASTALFGQLGGMGKLQYLPDLFKWSLLGGGVALFVLALMAITSFDRVIKFMTFRKWKWLHRLVYAAGVLVILHIWTIGTHLAYRELQVAGYTALVLLIGLELFRIATPLNNKYLKLDKTETVVMWLSLWAIAAALLLAIPSYIQNYHSRHTTHNSRSHNHQEVE